MNLLKICAALSAAVLCFLLVGMVGRPAGITAAATPKVPRTPDVLAIRDVRVFDGERTWPSATVLVKGGLIEAIGAGIAIPADAEIVDGNGHTLLPGLIDAHVHTWGNARSEALRFGVTTQIDMFTDHRSLPAARAERASLARTDRTDMWSAGTLATVEGGHGTQFGMGIPTLAGPEQASAWVAARKEEGSDFIKLVREDLHVYSESRRIPTLDANTAEAVIDAAHAQGLRAVVHTSAQEAARESLRAGADGLVHVFQDAVADDAFVALARQSGAFVVPTLSVVAGFAGERSALAGDEHIGPYLSRGQKQTLQARMHDGSARPALIANARQNVRRLHAAGVTVLAGTDAPNPNTAHGASMHEELAQLVQAGLSPQQALAAATSGPARAFGLPDRGRIAPGLRADLVLVKGDPTREITSTRAIVAIWKNGHRVDRDPATPKPGRLALGRISHFDGDTIDAPGAGWIETTDRMAGGQSQAGIERVQSGAAGSAGALRISGEIVPGAAHVWAGAMLRPGGGQMQPVDASHARELVFQVRGDGRRYSALVFSGETMSPMPSMQAFTATPQWTRVRLPLAGFAGADPATLAGMAFTAGEPAGAFWFELDDVEIR